MFTSHWVMRSSIGRLDLQLWMTLGNQTYTDSWRGPIWCDKLLDCVWLPSHLSISSWRDFAGKVLDWYIIWGFGILNVCQNCNCWKDDQTLIPISENGRYMTCTRSNNRGIKDAILIWVLEKMNCNIGESLSELNTFKWFLQWSNFH